MKKAFDQTVRELKREVNKKVLKVPSIEQKILDATSNEPWGPHGSLLADISQATRNYHEYQMIMTVIWKRINDTGKNWRHVYKALTVLDYLVAHGSERVIDEIREHAYQISTLSDFQYIDSSGRDQGSNVRRKSQTLVALVNDKEKIQEARQKALTNRDKYRSSFSTGGSYRPSSYSTHGGYGDRYDDDRFEGRYGARDEDRNSYGRDREWGYKDDDRYGRGEYGREVDRYSRNSDERYGRDNRDDDYRSNRGDDDYRFGPRNRSFDGERSPDDYRGSGARGDEASHDDRKLERNLSDQSISVPPSYEDVIRNAPKQLQDERLRDGESVAASAPKATLSAAPSANSPSEALSQVPQHCPPTSTSGTNAEADAFDEFDPRGHPLEPVSHSVEVDLFGSVGPSDPLDSLALVPVTTLTTAEVDAQLNSGMQTSFVPLPSASNALDQNAENPFGDAPFKATPKPQEPFQTQQQNFPTFDSFHPSGSVEPGHPPVSAPKTPTVPRFDFGDQLDGIAYASITGSTQHPSVNPGIVAPDFPVAQAGNDITRPPQTGSTGMMSAQHAQAGGLGKLTNVPVVDSNMLSQASLTPQIFSSSAQTAQTAIPTNSLATASLSFPSQTSMNTKSALEALSVRAGVAPGKDQPSKDKFEPKSAVWADTLNRGLVDLNISGPKTNPLANIGVDFESINRMEKRKEKSSATTSTSTTTMGKAMGSGSGIGHGGAGILAPANQPMMGSGMGMGRGMGMGGAPGMGMGVHAGGMNQPMGMNMGMNQVAPMRPAYGLAPGPGMPGYGYNPMMGMGTYTQQQPYGGGYR